MGQQQGHMASWLLERTAAGPGSQERVSATFRVPRLGVGVLLGHGTTGLTKAHWRFLSGEAGLSIPFPSFSRKPFLTTLRYLQLQACPVSTVTQFLKPSLQGRISSTGSTAQVDLFLRWSLPSALQSVKQHSQHPGCDSPKHLWTLLNVP